MMKPQLLIGAATSGSGKTTFTMGLLRALKKRGLQVRTDVTTVEEAAREILHVLKKERL